MKNILIGGAWPYANGSLHIGHIAALLPGDVLARYYRAKGDRVFFVSGSDCHGTPVTIRARQDGVSPEEVSNRYHGEFCSVLRQLGFSYDLYGKTSDAFHVAFVTAFHEKMYQSGLVYEKWAPQAFCARCDKSLTDRLVTGLCPSCGQPARGGAVRCLRNRTGSRGTDSAPVRLLWRGHHLFPDKAALYCHFPPEGRV